MDPRKKSYETGSIKYAPCLKYLSNTVKYMQIFRLNILIKKKEKKVTWNPVHQICCYGTK